MRFRQNQFHRFPKDRALFAAFALGLGFSHGASATRHPVSVCGDHVVTTSCSSGDDGTLRKAFMCAGDGDSIDLTDLKACTITLVGPLTDSDAASDVTVIGPGRNELTLDGNKRWRIFTHNGGGTLSVNGMTVTNGYLNNPYNYGGGGCVYSSGSVDINSSVVENCKVNGSGGTARGGAIFAKAVANVSGGIVKNSSAVADANQCIGGGIRADTVTLTNSSVTGNKICGGNGGGVFANNFNAYYSIVSGNYSISSAGAVYATSAHLKDSTISGNSAGYDVAGVLAVSAEVDNSTIVNNFHIHPGGRADGLHVEQSATVQSSIIANNFWTSNTEGSDFYAAAVFGANNLITSTLRPITLPADTLSVDPKITPLQDNGGPTLTHALLPGSPAINRGNNVSQSADDQRLISERTVGTRPDIGAFESDTLMVDGFEKPPK